MCIQKTQAAKILCVSSCFCICVCLRNRAVNSGSDQEPLPACVSCLHYYLLYFNTSRTLSVHITFSPNHIQSHLILWGPVGFISPEGTSGQRYSRPAVFPIAKMSAALRISSFHSHFGSYLTDSVVSDMLICHNESFLIKTCNVWYWFSVCPAASPVPCQSGSRWICTHLSSMIEADR